jgi:hypothetical protein
MTDLADKSGGLAALMWALMNKTNLDGSQDPTKEGTGYALLQIIYMIMGQLQKYGDQIADMGSTLQDFNSVRVDLANVNKDLANIQNYVAMNPDDSNPDKDPTFRQLVNQFVKDMQKMATDTTTIMKKYPKGSDAWNAFNEVQQSLENFNATMSPANGGNTWDPNHFPGPDQYGNMFQAWINGDGVNGGWGRFLAYDLFNDAKSGTSGSSTTGVFAEFANGGAGGPIGFATASTDLTTIDSTYNTTLTADGTYMNQVIQSSQNFVSTVTGEGSYYVQKQIAN